MNVSHTAKKSLLVLAIMGLFSAPAMHAVGDKTFFTKVGDKLTKENMIFLAVAAAVARVLIKYNPNNERKSLTENIKGLASNPFKKEFWGHLWGILDDNFIGHKGRLRGPRAYGSKVIIDGVTKPVEGEFYDERGYKIDLVQYNHVSAYGLLGCLWSRLAMISSGLKPLKELKDNLIFANKLYDKSTLTVMHFFGDEQMPEWTTDWDYKK